MEYHCCLQNMLARKRMKLLHPRDWLLLPSLTLRNIKLKERLTNHMYPKDKSESYLMNNCLSGTMSLGANLLSIFEPSYFLTVTYNNEENKPIFDQPSKLNHVYSNL